MAGTKLTPDLADKLLDKLGSDDAFRALFVKDAKAAMQQLGAPKDFDCADCERTQPLPSKELFKRSRETFRKALNSTGGMTIFTIETK